MKPERDNLETFLGLYNNPNTRNGYSVAVRSFIDSVYGRQREGAKLRPSEKIGYEHLVDRYLSENRDYKEDLTQYAVTLQNRPPLSAKKTFCYVKEFLAAQGIELKSVDLKRIRCKLPKGGPRTVEKDLDTETIRTILQHLDIKGKALVLVLASSGMRIAEALSVTLDDVDLNEVPALIQIRGSTTKTGENRYTFISAEAVLAVRGWLKVRDNYLKSARNRNMGFVRTGMANPRDTSDMRLFPFSSQTASQMWDTALKKAGLFSKDSVTRRKQLHYHMFRKFFISQMSLVVSKEIPEVLAGHSGYLTDAYRRYTKAQLREYYLKAEPAITIQPFVARQTVPNEVGTTVQEHAELLDSLVKKNVRLEEDLKNLKREIRLVTDLFHDLSACSKKPVVFINRVISLEATDCPSEKPRESLTESPFEGVVYETKAGPTLYRMVYEDS
ncbi:MAG: site-specific integrase [Methanoregula sp.]|jgi:integrase